MMLDKTHIEIGDVFKSKMGFGNFNYYKVIDIINNTAKVIVYSKEAREVGKGTEHLSTLRYMKKLSSLEKELF